MVVLSLGDQLIVLAAHALLAALLFVVAKSRIEANCRLSVARSAAIAASALPGGSSGGLDSVPPHTLAAAEALCRRTGVRAGWFVQDAATRVLNIILVIAIDTRAPPASLKAAGLEVGPDAGTDWVPFFWMLLTFLTYVEHIVMFELFEGMPPGFKRFIRIHHTLALTCYANIYVMAFSYVPIISYWEAGVCQHLWEGASLPIAAFEGWLAAAPPTLHLPSRRRPSPVHGVGGRRQPRLHESTTVADGTTTGAGTMTGATRERQASIEVSASNAPAAGSIVSAALPVAVRDVAISIAPAAGAATAPAASTDSDWQVMSGRRSFIVVLLCRVAVRPINIGWCLLIDLTVWFWVAHGNIVGWLVMMGPTVILNVFDAYNTIVAASRDAAVIEKFASQASAHGAESPIAVGKASEPAELIRPALVPVAAATAALPLPITTATGSTPVSAPIPVSAEIELKSVHSRHPPLRRTNGEMPVLSLGEQFVVLFAHAVLTACIFMAAKTRVEANCQLSIARSAAGAADSIPPHTLNAAKRLCRRTGVRAGWYFQDAATRVLNIVLAIAIDSRPPPASLNAAGLEVGPDAGTDWIPFFWMLLTLLTYVEHIVLFEVCDGLPAGFKRFIRMHHALALVCYANIYVMAFSYVPIISYWEAGVCQHLWEGAAIPVGTFEFWLSAAPPTLQAAPRRRPSPIRPHHESTTLAPAAAEHTITGTAGTVGTGTGTNTVTGAGTVTDYPMREASEVSASSAPTTIGGGAVAFTRQSVAIPVAVTAATATANNGGGEFIASDWQLISGRRSFIVALLCRVAARPINIGWCLMVDLTVWFWVAHGNVVGWLVMMGPTLILNCYDAYNTYSAARRDASVIEKFASPAASAATSAAATEAALGEAIVHAKPHTLQATVLPPLPSPPALMPLQPLAPGPLSPSILDSPRAAVEASILVSTPVPVNSAAAVTSTEIELKSIHLNEHPTASA